MTKQYTLTNVVDVSANIEANHIGGYDGAGSPLYYIFRIVWQGTGINGGAKRTESVGMNDGSPSTTKFNKRQIYQRVKTVMGNAVANLLKDLHEELIDEDISEE